MLKVWDLKSSACVHDLHRPGRPRASEFVTDRATTHVVATYDDGDVLLWDLRKVCCVWHTHTHTHTHTPHPNTHTHTYSLTQLVTHPLTHSVSIRIIHPTVCSYKLWISYMRRPKPTSQPAQPCAQLWKHKQECRDVQFSSNGEEFARTNTHATHTHTHKRSHPCARMHARTLILAFSNSRTKPRFRNGHGVV